MSAKQRKFNHAKIIRESRCIKTILDPDLGLIRYVTLKHGDMAEIMKKYQDPMERGFQMVFRMLRPTNPGLMEQDILDLPFDVVCRLMTVLAPKNGYLPTNQPKPPVETVDLPKSDEK
jgi:hypothetical protein